MGRDISFYGLLTAWLILAAGVALVDVYRNRGWRKRDGALFALAAIFLGLLLGRTVYCLVRYDMFEDAMGRSLGIRPFFDLGAGSLSVIGIIAGVLLAAAIAAKRQRAPLGAVLDAAAVPGLFLFFVLRLIEPLAGQGYGPLLETPALCWSPLGIQNGWGEWSLSVSFVEAVLLLVIGAVTASMKTKKTGTRAMMALLLLAACQIVPESLRRDNVLRIFIFARVTQIGYAVTVFGSAVAAWMRGIRQGVKKKTVLGEAALVLLGIGLLIAGEFALDKTKWPDGAIYAVMLLILALITALILRRMLLEDRREAR